MNYLAHLFLTSHHPSPEISIGNFIADLISKKQSDLLSPGLKKGVDIHRVIDSYTDKSEIVSNTLSLFRPSQGKYAPVVVDIIFDYFLYSNWGIYSNQSYDDFKVSSYELLETNLTIPEKASKRVKSMLFHGFLDSYSSIEGIENVMQRMDKITKFSSDFVSSVRVMQDDFDEINKDFNEFFPKLQQKVNQKIEELIIT